MPLIVCRDGPGRSVRRVGAGHERAVDAVDLAQLAPGDVIVLDHLVEDPLRIMVGNCERYAGFPGTKGRKMALQVSGLVDDDGWVKSFEEAVDE